MKFKFSISIRTLLFFLAMCLIACPLHAQIKLISDIRVGYASYQMSDLKLYQAYDNTQTQYPMNVSESFPASVNYSINFMLKSKEHFFNFVLGHSNANGKSSYSNNGTGRTTTFDVNLLYTGASYGRKISSAGNTDFYVGGQLLSYYNGLGYHTVSYFQGAVEGDGTENTISNAVSISPFVEAHRAFGKLFLRGHAGYEFFIAEDLHYIFSSDAKIGYTTASGEDHYVNLNPQGFRVDVGVGYVFK